MNARLLLRRLLPAATLAAGAALLPPPAHAQQGSAVLAVVVSSASTREPLQGARVTVSGTELSGVTNGAGAVRLVGLPAGGRTVEVRLLGHATERVEVRLAHGEVHDLELELEVQPVAVPGVEGSAERGTRGARMLRSMGFYERLERGSGTFITRADIERAQPRLMSDLLRRYASTKLQTNIFNRARVTSRRSGSSPNSGCQPMFYLNGVPAPGLSIDDYNPDEVEGIEIYRGPSEAPPSFRQSSDCGVIVIWSRIN